MKIGIIITRIGGVDGVALETEKWCHVMERMGHQIKILTGRLERPLPWSVEELPELYLYNSHCEIEQQEVFFQPQKSEEEVVDLLQNNCQILVNKIQDWLSRHQLDTFISQNASALPCHLSMGMAIAQIIKQNETPAILHHHDFYWERGERYQTPYSQVSKIMAECFPPQNENIEHVVINTYNQKRLKDRLRLEALYVPNVMDFKTPFATKDNFNQDLKNKFNIQPTDKLLAQVTRIVERKGIETAIELLHLLDNPSYKLLITGSAQDETKKGYFESLVALTKKLNLDNQVTFTSDSIAHFRAENPKIYSLSDIYAHADACTYFSKYEGFGNAFVEAVLAKRPIFVNNYEPVYWPDIGSLGFATVMIENNNLLPEKVAAIKEVLENQKLAQEMAETNYNLGAKYFSWEVLEEKLDHLLS